MLFNSLQFAIFFIIVYGLYLLLNHRWQNILLLVASYIFYGFWDWRFLSLIFISTIIDYISGIKIYETDNVNRRKFWLILSVCTNLGMLGFFKYFNFFADSLQGFLQVFGFNIEPLFLKVVLPVGISFYTFQTLSYSIDIYRRKIAPTRRFLDYALFVAFFPQLVAGPIERAKNLLPQILNKRKIDLNKLYDGSWLVFYGLFKKVVIADNMGTIVDLIFGSNGMENGLLILIGSYAFAFQIYCDFSGYSSIARGIAKLMGFDIMVNFRLPYFAANMSDFWRRWHISLSSWLKDYLYIPLGGNRRGKAILYRNLILTMFLGGLWHGASWTFAIWGLYHGMILVLLRVIKPVLSKIIKFKSFLLNNLLLSLKCLITFHLVCFGWIIFRSQSQSQLWSMVHNLIFHFELTRGIGIRMFLLRIVIFAWLLILIEIFQFIKKDLMIIFRWHPLVRYFVYMVMLLLIFVYGDFGEKEFIYFQF